MLVAWYALPAAPAFAALSAPEQRIVAAVDQGQPAAIALLERLVNVNSGTSNLAGVTEVGRIVRQEFERLGLQVQWIPMSAAGRAGHLIARHQGRAGTQRMLLIGHLDTVFEADSPFQRFERRGDFAQGPGVSDDKGGIVVILAALQAMRAAGTLRAANIVVVLTGDEEAVGSPIEVARADLISAGEHADVALDYEGLVVLDGKDMGSIARRSADSFLLTTHGIAAHSSGIFSADVGDGAIFEMARIISAFRAELPEPNLTFNIGVLAGGATAAIDANESAATASGKTNVVPSIAVANGDFRTLSVEQNARVKAKMEAIVARHLPHTDATITYAEAYPPMAPTAGNRALLARLNLINADLGLPAMAELDPLERGAGDISFVAERVDGLAGLGTASTGDHTAAETVDLRSIRREAIRTALLLTRLSHEASARDPP